MARADREEAQGGASMKPASNPRETIEMVDGSVYYSDDHWVTIYKVALGGQGGARKVTGSTADRVRYIAVLQHGGGRDDKRRARK
jgi:hypothetical protein